MKLGQLLFSEYETTDSEYFSNRSTLIFAPMAKPRTGHIVMNPKQDSDEK